MKILITGIGGFVGQNLSEALRRAGHEIFGLSREKNDAPAGTLFTWRDFFAGTPETPSLPPFDAVIHLAGKAHDLKNRSRAQVYFDVNTELTKKIFRWFLASPSARQFYFFSSVKAVAECTRGNVPLTETSIPSPAGPYGESKLAAEKFLRENFDFSSENNSARGGDCEKRVYILRPAMIHGRGNKGNLNLLYAVVRRNFPWILGAFENRRTFLSIKNCAFVLEKMLAGTPLPSGIYNLADDESLSTNALVETMCTALGKRARIVKFSPRALRLCAAAGTLLHLPFNRDRLGKLTENFIVSNEKIRRALGVKTLPVPAREGIIETTKSFVAPAAAVSPNGEKNQKGNFTL